jgi:hypothetical protein
VTSCDVIVSAYCIRCRRLVTTRPRYEILRAEIHNAAATASTGGRSGGGGRAQGGRSSRHPKKYAPKPCPLAAVRGRHGIVCEKSPHVALMLWRMVTSCSIDALEVGHLMLRSIVFF